MRPDDLPHPFLHEAESGTADQPPPADGVATSEVTSSRELRLAEQQALALFDEGAEWLRLGGSGFATLRLIIQGLELLGPWHPDGPPHESAVALVVRELTQRAHMAICREIDGETDVYRA